MQLKLAIFVILVFILAFLTLCNFNVYVYGTTLKTFKTKDNLYKKALEEVNKAPRYNTIAGAQKYIALLAKADNALYESLIAGWMLSDARERWYKMVKRNPTAVGFIISADELMQEKKNWESKEAYLAELEEAFFFNENDEKTETAEKYIVEKLRSGARRFQI